MDHNKTYRKIKYLKVLTHVRRYESYFLSESFF
jgi:hypothetical protein